MYMYHMWGPAVHYGGIGILGGVLSFFFWILIILLIIGVVRAAFGHGSRRRRFWHEDHDDALSILKQRYAKGEIDKEEYETKKKDLVD